MSFVDLATLVMRRRQELEARLDVFLEKCELAVQNITKLKHQVHGFLDQLDCEASELKDKFLSCMNQLEEFNYLITDFNLALDNLDGPVKGSTNYITPMPVHNVSNHPSLQTPLLPIPMMNLMDALSEPIPSTSKACSSTAICRPPDKPSKKRVRKDHQLLIEFSSESGSLESVSESKCESEGQSILANDVQQLSLEESPVGEINLPGQKVLQVDCEYPATITHVDGLSFYVITEYFEDAHNLIVGMNEFYRENFVELSLDDLMSLTYCATYDVDSNCFFRGFFIRLTKEDMSIAEVFLVDVGENWLVSIDTIQPLDRRFRTKAPFARCCHFAGLDLNHSSKEQEMFLKEFINKPCHIRIDDNSSESLGAYVIIPSGEILNDLLVLRGLARKIDRSSKASTESSTPVFTDLRPVRGPQEPNAPMRVLPLVQDPPPVRGLPGPTESPPARGLPGPTESLPARGLPGPTESPPARGLPGPTESLPARGLPGPTESPPARGLPGPTESPSARGLPGPAKSPPTRGLPGPTESPPARGLPELDEANLDITNCPEYDDPLVAVTGYHNRDEMDICKHYKGGPDRTCFKGRRCTKRHVLKHPDGWTLDRLPVVAKCPTIPLPAPGTILPVNVTHVPHFNHFYVHLVDNSPEKHVPVPEFGVVLPPTTLSALVLDMNSPASRTAYKRLKLIPATGELVAALYPPDEQWYRARVITSSRADQNVEVMYIDYGNMVWVKEDSIRELEPRFWPLPAQAISCKLAGVKAKTNESRDWAAARKALETMIQERVLQARIIARDYDEVTVELTDERGFSVAEELAAKEYVDLEEYEVVNDTDVTHRVVVP